MIALSRAGKIEARILIDDRNHAKTATLSQSQYNGTSLTCARQWRVLLTEKYEKGNRVRRHAPFHAREGTPGARLHPVV